MNKQKLIIFLEKFEIKEEIIEEFLKDKQIIEINKNIFLTKNNFKENQVLGNNLLFIQLNNLLPSKYLLNFIFHNSKNQVQLRGEKQALNFTYTKPLSFDSIRNVNQLRFEKDKYYLVVFENSVIGYFEYEVRDKKHPLRNVFNIGEYLHEN